MMKPEGRFSEITALGFLFLFCSYLALLKFRIRCTARQRDSIWMDQEP